MLWGRSIILQKNIYMRRSELYSLKQEEKALDKYVNQYEKLALEAGIGPDI